MQGIITYRPREGVLGTELWHQLAAQSAPEPPVGLTADLVSLLAAAKVPPNLR